jgi:hypothetical protein
VVVGQTFRHLVLNEPGKRHLTLYRYLFPAMWISWVIYWWISGDQCRKTSRGAMAWTRRPDFHLQEAGVRSRPRSEWQHRRRPAIGSVRSRRTPRINHFSRVRATILRYRPRGVNTSESDYGRPMRDTRVDRVPRVSHM